MKKLRALGGTNLRQAPSRHHPLAGLAIGGGERIKVFLNQCPSVCAPLTIASEPTMPSRHDSTRQLPQRPHAATLCAGAGTVLGRNVAAAIDVKPLPTDLGDVVATAFVVLIPSNSNR